MTWARFSRIEAAGFQPAEPLVTPTVLNHNFLKPRSFGQTTAINTINDGALRKNSEGSVVTEKRAASGSGRDGSAGRHPGCRPVARGSASSADRRPAARVPDRAGFLDAFRPQCYIWLLRA